MTRFSSIFLIATLMAAGIVVTGCNAGKKEQAQKTPEVSVVAIRPQSVPLTSELPGRTTAFRVAEIRPQVNGLIQKRLFTEGSRVEAGQLLYEIDSAPYKAAYDSAEANLLSAKQAAARAQATLEASMASLGRFEAVLKLAVTNHNRYDKLLEKKAVSAMEHDQAEVDVEVARAALKVANAQVASDRQSIEVAKAAIKQAEAALETTRINLNYTKITAPITGYIGRSNVTDGAIATAYQMAPLATVQQLDPIYVDVPQSTVELNRLRRNASLKEIGNNKKVKILLEDGSEYEKEGELQFKDVTVDPTTGSVILRIIVPNRNGTLLPGMYIRAIIEEGVRDNAILVPQQAVSRDPKGNPYALIVDDKDVTKMRQLKTERAIVDKWLISEGLQPGERVVVAGPPRLLPDTPVKVIKTLTKANETLAAKPAAEAKDAAAKAAN